MPKPASILAPGRRNSVNPQQGAAKLCHSLAKPSFIAATALELCFEDRNTLAESRHLASRDVFVRCGLPAQAPP